MRGAVAAAVLVLMPDCGAFGQGPRDFDELYQTHQWFAYRDAVRKTARPADLWRGVAACAFYDMRGCEQYMERVAGSGAAAGEKVAAHMRLYMLYMSLGQSRRALPHHDAAWKLHGPASEPDTDGALLQAYARFPDMSIAAHHACSLPYDRRGERLAVPVTIDGALGIYTLDTGAGYSTVSESEARRVGMHVVEIAAIPLGGFTGATAPVGRIGVAETVELGRIELKNVPFLVLPDQAAEGLLASGGGALGFQVLVACQTIRWTSGGLVQLGSGSSGRRNMAESNLCFDDDVIRVQAEFGGRKLDFKLDTGGTSYLLESFGTAFPAMAKSGQQGRWSSGGLGAGNADLPATILPVIELALGTRGRCILRPAPMIQIPGSWGDGLLGFDAFEQARAVTLDFRRMMLTVE
jgi:hypothetical protein